MKAMIHLVAAVALALGLGGCDSDSETTIDTAIVTPVPEITPSATVPAGSAAPATTAQRADAPATESTTAQRTTVSAEQKTEPSAVSDGGNVALTGHQFRGKEFDPPHLEAQGMQLLQHYGVVQAQVKLQRDFSTVRIALTPRSVNDSSPVVGLLFERTGGGKYVREQVLQDEVIQTPNEISKSVNLPAGDYLVSMQFYKSSGTGRAQLEIHSITLQ